MVHTMASLDDRFSTEPKQLQAQHVESSQGRLHNGQAETQAVEYDEYRAKVVHADGTIDYVDAQAIGGEVGGMPRGYFMSPQFIGTVVVSIMTAVFGILEMNLISADLLWLPGPMSCEYLCIS
jgi:hypothetical protein